jgi:hypothetical protein
MSGCQLPSYVLGHAAVGMQAPKLCHATPGRQDGRQVANMERAPHATEWSLYTAINLELPPWLLKAFDKIRKGFLWTETDEVQGGKCLVAWVGCNGHCS